jgi:SPP1 gp7 family putative phage head morphogenesis protein
MTLLHQLLDFYDAPAAASFTVPPAQAIAYFRSKGLQVTFDWRDMIGAEHASAFTIAKMADIDLLADVQASLDDAIAQGLSYDTWADTITPLLQQRGWWGRQAVTDPLTGETIVAQLGSPSRLKTIFRTNVQSAYAAGQWEQIQEQKDVAEYLMYDAVDDHRTRPQHAAWDGTILPVDHDWWRTHYPPNGWNCRCGVIQLAEEDLEDLGLTPSAKAPAGGTTNWTNPRTGKVEKVDKGLDPGWNSNPGASHLQQLQKLAGEKIKALDPKAAAAAAKGMKATEAAATALAEQAGIAVQPAIEATATQLAKGAGKAQIRAAETAIANALKDNTPYLAKSIKALQATKAGQQLPPIELLQKAQAAAGKSKDSAALANWKKAQIEGKPGSAAGQAVFDALPEPAQASIVAEVQQQAAANLAAKAIDEELAAIAQGLQGPVPQFNLAAAAAAAPDLTPAQLLAEVKAMPAKLTSGQQSSGLSGWKKNAIAGKPPTPKQQLAFDSLTDLQKAKALQQVDDAKAALAAPPPPEVPPGPPPLTTAVPDLNPDQLRQIGGQRGSNRGGTYVDEATGTEWYVKFPASEDMARNEVLAAKLYEAAGIDVPDLRLIQLEGQPAIASRIVDGLAKGSPEALAKGGAFDGFAVDAWLANWDVAGATLDNLLVRGTQAFRVDTGGALRYRAQGGLKGQAFGDQVTEIQSLRNAGTAPQASRVFGKMTDADIEQSVARVLAIDDSTIDRMLAEFGPRDPSERGALSARLKARRDDLARQYPNAARRALPQPDAPDRARVTATEQAEVVASRVNGYTFRTDGDQIEDQNVIVSQVTSASGRPVTRMFLKVRDTGAQAIARKLPDGGGGANLDELRGQTLSLLKSINFRAGKGQALDATVSAKWATLRGHMDALEAQLAAAEGLAPAAAAKALAQVQALRTELTAYFADAGVTKPLSAFRQVDLNAFADVPAASRGAGGLPWQKRGAVSYELADFDRSNARLRSQTQQLAGTAQHYAIEGDGYRVTYVPAEGNAIASRGVVMIDIDGAGTAATGRGFQILEEIGVNATRSSQAERLELYLDRIAYVRTLRNPKLEAALATAGDIADPAARAQAKLQLLNADAGADMTKSRWWNPDGEHQAFGHGRVLLNRPDLDDADVQAFASSHVVYHNTSSLGVGGSPQWERLRSIIEGGGQIGSQIDRMRRGVASFGSSVTSDHTSGGANYIFTRLRTRASGMKKAGVYWNPERLLRRSDAFTYTGDRFGTVDRAMQVKDRQIDPAGWRKAAASASNETNFRDSISVFDDVERIVLASRAEYNEALGGMRAMGYRTWPDGRALEDVFDYEGSTR